MNPLKDKNGVWFVYDGECPICSYAAHALRIKETFGQLNLLNAREFTDDPILREINARAMDLDEGMVIYCEGKFYHGKDALTFMAKYGDARGLFNRASTSLFRSEKLAAVLYPWMRGARNMLLRLLKKSKIDNLNCKTRPIFQPVFGEHWEKLPPVIRKHYANRPYSNDKVIVEGVLDVTCRSYMKALRPFYRLLGTVPTVTEKGVPVSVHFESAQNAKAFHFNRIFYFKERKPYHFRSRMVQVKANEITEIMRFGICWRTDYAWENGKVALKHKGYALNVFGHVIPLPLTWLLGRGDAEEIAVDDDHFDMNVKMTHPVFGEVYSYAGRFKVTKEA